MSDIVERLRDPLRHANKDPVCKEAADEIERLRAELLACQLRNVALMIPKLAVSSEEERLITELKEVKADRDALRAVLIETKNSLVRLNKSVSTFGIAATLIQNIEYALGREER